MTNLITYIKAFFTAHSVDDILSDFTYKVKKLEAHAEAKIVASDLYKKWVEEYNDKAAQADAEVAKAKAIAAKIKELINGTTS